MHVFFLVLLALLQVLDGLTTLHIIERLRGREVNPLMAWLFRRYSMRRILAIKGVVVVSVVALWAPEAAWVVCLIYSLVVGHNIVSIYRKT